MAKNSFAKRLKSMLQVDFRRLFTGKFFYIMVGVSFVVPILILVMTTMMDGTVSVNPQTGVETVMEGFDNVWQIFGSTTSASANAGMDMGLTTMCNINMMYFAVGVLVSLFTTDDFRSGYAKNVFTVRAKKSDYVASKTIVGFVSATAMFIAFFIGAMLGGGIANLPFTMDGFNGANFALCMLAKIFLTLVFVGVSVLAGAVAKHRAWLAVLLTFAFGMLLFAMIPMITPLDATLLHALLCAVGGIGFALGLGAISNVVLNKTSLI
ncbi:MAG: ABC transporter permease [Clostridia bacterium]|nr:ABC transporter permease [Clostridia bacterium]